MHPVPLLYSSDYTVTRCYEKCVLCPGSLLLDVYFFTGHTLTEWNADLKKKQFIQGYQGPRSKYVAVKLSGVSSGKDF